jgi:predicted GNAT superfamily acetyltransferase
MQNVTLADGTVIRALATHEERAEAVRLQEETWGAGFSEKVPAAILLVAEKTGGVAAGAFTPAGRMVGFVFGLTGVRDGTLVHWSDILAVRPEAQGRRLGEAMKLYQRDRCRAIGVEHMYWTFDPFVARNAHLNLNVLGASVDEFIPDMYGASTGSMLHGTLGTDRFVALWPITRSPHPVPDDPMFLVNAPVAGGAPTDAPGPGDLLPDERRVVVRIPDDYSTLLSGDPSVARAWRASARRAFLHYLHGGYRVTAFVPGRGRDAAYLLSAP